MDGTIPIDGWATEPAIDALRREMYLITCRGCHQEESGQSYLVTVVDLESRVPTDGVELTDVLWGTFPQLAADPYAGFSYVTRARGSGVVMVIESASQAVADSIDAGRDTLWDLAVDPSTGHVYVVQEAPDAKPGPRVTVIQGSRDPPARSSTASHSARWTRVRASQSTRSASGCLWPTEDRDD